MPIVPDVPAHGGDQDDDRGAARLSGPLFRDDTPQTASYGTPSHNQPSPQEPMPSAHQPAPAPQKKSAGRDLGAAIGVGVGLGAVIIASLFIVKAVFVGVIAVAVVVGLWELTSRLEERKGIKAPLVPLARRWSSPVTSGAPRARGWRWRSPRWPSWSGG
jgi:phosphatidate cytidylyltransferase